MSNRSFKEAATCTTRYVSISDEAVKLKTKSEGRARRGGGGAGRTRGKKPVMREKRGNPRKHEECPGKGKQGAGTGALEAAAAQVRAPGAVAVKISSISRVRVSEYW